MTSTLERDRSGSSKRDSKQDSVQHRVKSAHIITEHIDVAVPVEAAFDQWMQFDKWSEMFKAESASKERRKASRPQADTAVEVTAKIGPSRRQWKAQVVGIDPPKRVAWKSKGPLQGMGATSFHRIDDRLTRVMVEIEYRPTGVIETIGNFFRMQRRRVRRDLRLFKNYMELRGSATGRGPRRSQGEGLRDAIDGGGAAGNGKGK
jgi:uncharacterized membrane protein